MQRTAALQFQGESRLIGPFYHPIDTLYLNERLNCGPVTLG